MPNQKYTIATSDSRVAITLRNMLNSAGYEFLGTYNESVALMRHLRACHPDFLIIDFDSNIRGIERIIEILEDDMLCACIIIGDMQYDIEKSLVLSRISKPINKEVLHNTVTLAMVNYSRVLCLNKKLREANENLESRKIIDKAKGILMQREKITESEAYSRMRKKSMDRRITMKNVADAIIMTHELSLYPIPTADNTPASSSGSEIISGTSHG